MLPRQYKAKHALTAYMRLWCFRADALKTGIFPLDQDAGHGKEAGINTCSKVESNGIDQFFSSK